ncbi:hypothetical protein N8654_02165 [Synechococcus sp. AH-601-B19]|nr:hypothetical protein [Synechococcus sp. AH-601-B19]
MDYRALEDKSSPYYYGEDATYKAPPSSRKSSRKIQYELDEDGLPVQSRQESTAERTARRKKVGLPVGERPGGNRIRVGGKEYAEGDPALQKVLDGNRKKQPRMADIRGGGGLDTYEAPTEYLSDDASVTPLNSNPARPPRTAGEFGDFMKTLTADYGIKFPGEQQRNGYESIHLPGTDSNADEFSASDAVTMGMSPQQAIDRKNGGTTEIVIGGNMGAQSGSSPAADQGEAQRVVKGFNGHEFGGEHEAPATSGLDARRRAFLDYDGKGGSIMALRAAEAAQGTIKQNGELYAVGDDGKASVRISDAGEQALKKDGNQMASQEFLKNYRYVPDSPAETESADSQQPAMPSGDIADVDTDTGKFTRGKESNVIADPTKTFKALGLM